MAKPTTSEYVGLLFAERLFLLQETPYNAVNNTKLRLSLEERKKIKLSESKISRLLPGLLENRRSNTHGPWFRKEGNRLLINHPDKVIRDHRSSRSLLAALQSAGHDPGTQTKIVFDIAEWTRSQGEAHGLSSELCHKFLVEYRSCGYTRPFSKMHEEIERDHVNDDRHVLEAIAISPEIFRSYE